MLNTQPSPRKRPTRNSRVLKKKRKYTIGDNACSYCQQGNHRNCRPKLDGTLCSCSCHFATAIREDYALRVEEAHDTNTPVPSAERVVQETFHPYYKAVFALSE